MREKLAAGFICLALSTVLMGCPLFEGPEAAFTATPTEGNVPLTVLFVDQSQPGSTDLTNWQWDFGDGLGSTAQNPSHVYTAPGVYRVTLSATSRLGIDTETKIDYITVRALPTANFTASPRAGEGPLQVTFTNISMPGAAPITLYEWDFGDGTNSEEVNPVHLYEDPGTYTVKLKVTTEIGESTETKANFISVQQRPVASFTASPTAGASPLAVQFTDTSTPGSSPITRWFWDFGDGTSDTRQNPSHIYAAAGSYTVALSVTSEVGMSPIATQMNFIVVEELPVANFGASPTTGPAPLNVNFTDMSSGGSDEITEWLWDFGDSTSSTLPSPSHRYASDGVYDVSLTVTTSSGTTHTRTKSNFITAQQSPDAAFSATPRNGEAPLTVRFTDLSDPGSAPITSWQWDFGDGSTSTDRNPFHSYTAPGRYTIRLQVETAVGGDFAEQVNYIQVEQKPVASFTASPLSGPAPLTIDFTDQSTNGSSAITEWAWDFGDGTSSNQRIPNPPKTYTQPGTYTVSLTVTSAAGTSTSTRSNYITVRERPAADFTSNVTTGPAPLTVTFTDQTAPGSQTLSGWQWDFGDGETSAQPNPSHIYGAPGVYTVSLTATSSVGSDTETKADYLVVRPAVNFTGTPTTGTGSASVSFADTTSLGLLDVESRTWNFGDGSAASSEENPVHIYTEPGLYTVTLTLNTTLDGQNDARTRTGFVTVQPEPAFSGDTLTGDGTLQVNFTNETELGSLNLLGVLWDFGDGTTSQSENPSHTYDEPGTYTVKLTVTTNAGVRTTTEAGFIMVRPVPDFTANVVAGTAPLTVAFTNTTELGTLTITGRLWDFGDGGTSTDANPPHLYAAAGTYDVTLTLTTSQGVVMTTTADFIEVAAPFGPRDSAAAVDRGQALLELASGGFAMAGAMNSGTGDGVDAFLALTDAGGITLPGWPKTYGGPGTQQALDMVPAADGGYLLAGFSDAGEGIGTHVYLLKVNADGDVVWERRFGGTGDNAANAIVALRDGGYAIAGRSGKAELGGGVDAYVLTVDENGEKPAEARFGGAGYDEAFDLVESSDGELVAAGESTSFGDGNPSAWVLKLGPDLAERASVTLDRTASGGARGIVEAAGGGFVLVGAADPRGTGLPDIFLLQLDCTLNDVLWERALGGAGIDRGLAVAAAADGGYLVTGAIDSGGEAALDVVLLRTDAGGNPVVNEASGEVGDDIGNAIIETGDGGVGIAGTGDAGGPGEHALLLRIKPAGSEP